MFGFPKSDDPRIVNYCMHDCNYRRNLQLRSRHRDERAIRHQGPKRPLGQKREHRTIRNQPEPAQATFQVTRGLSPARH